MPAPQPAPTAPMLADGASPSADPKPGESLGTAIGAISQGAAIGGGLIGKGATPEALGEAAQAVAGAGAAMLAGKAAPAVIGEVAKSAVGAAVSQGVAKAVSSIGESAAPNASSAAMEAAAPKAASTLAGQSTTSDTGALGEAAGTQSSPAHESATPAEALQSDGSKAASAPTAQDAKAPPADARPSADTTQQATPSKGDSTIPDTGKLEASDQANDLADTPAKSDSNALDAANAEASDKATDDLGEVIEGPPAEDANELAASSPEDASLNDSAPGAHEGNAETIAANDPSVSSDLAASSHSLTNPGLGAPSLSSVDRAAAVATAANTAVAATAAVLAFRGDNSPSAITTGASPEEATNLPTTATPSAPSSSRPTTARAPTSSRPTTARAPTSSRPTTARAPTSSRAPKRAPPPKSVHPLNKTPLVSTVHVTYRDTEGQQHTGVLVKASDPRPKVKAFEVTENSGTPPRTYNVATEVLPNSASLKVGDSVSFQDNTKNSVEGKISREIEMEVPGWDVEDGSGTIKSVPTSAIQIDPQFAQRFEQHSKQGAHEPATIPKKIHLVWIGNPIHEQFALNVEQWKARHPDWEVTLWSDSRFGGYEATAQRMSDTGVRVVDVNGDPDLDKSWYQKEAGLTSRVGDGNAGSESNQWTHYGAASDLLRLYILQKHGGVYSDTDLAFDDDASRDVADDAKALGDRAIDHDNLGELMKDNPFQLMLHRSQNDAANDLMISAPQNPYVEQLIEMAHQSLDSLYADPHKLDDYKSTTGHLQSGRATITLATTGPMALREGLKAFYHAHAATDPKRVDFAVYLKNVKPASAGGWTEASTDATANTTGFAPAATTSGGQQAPSHVASGQTQSSSQTQQGMKDADLQSLIAQSNTWSHPPSNADKAAATKALGDLMRAQGADAALVQRLGELIQHPKSISQFEFATCALTSTVYSLLKDDLGGFARLVAAEFTGKLFDADGSLKSDFSFDGSPASSSAAATNPIQRVVDGKLDVAKAPVQNKLLSNGVKKAQAKRSDLENKGKVWSNEHLLDYLLARGLGKMLSKMAPAQYEADLGTTEKVNPGYRDKTPNRAVSAVGPSKKHGDLLLSADSLVTLVDQVLGGMRRRWSMARATISMPSMPCSNSRARRRSRSRR
ncbi:Hypothetical protein A7982_01315 [Minicystis rosea]|nr:Hypothetical protein A7982_01315 [Minicystis rosea]